MHRRQRLKLLLGRPVLVIAGCQSLAVVAALLLSPVAPGAAFPIGEKADDPLQMYLTDIYTVAVNLAGIPAISVPCAQTQDGLPIGVQLLGAPLQEPKLLQLAHVLERSEVTCTP